MFVSLKAAPERNEESLMDRLTRFAMSNSAWGTNEDGNSSKDPKRGNQFACTAQWVKSPKRYFVGVPN